MTSDENIIVLVLLPLVQEEEEELSFVIKCLIVRYLHYVLIVLQVVMKVHVVYILA